MRLKCQRVPHVHRDGRDCWEHRQADPCGSCLSNRVDDLTRRLRESEAEAEKARGDFAQAAANFDELARLARAAMDAAEHDLDDANADFMEAIRQRNVVVVREARLREALLACVAEIELLTAGESCDHAVNICWCATFDTMDIARQALAAAGTREGG